MKNMITGTSQADAAVLVVAANDGVNAQTKEHAFLARVLGVTQLIVNINKMDISGVDYQESKYNEVKTEVSNLLKMAGFKPNDVNFIAGSSQNGENIYNKSDNMSWYKGPTLFEAIDAITMPPKPTGSSSKAAYPRRLQDRRNRNSPVGKIETGVLNPVKDGSIQPKPEIG